MMRERFGISGGKPTTNFCLFLECCGYKITPTARPGGEYADHTPQGAWAPVASPDEVEASVVQRLDHWSVTCPAVRIKTTSGLLDRTSNTRPQNTG